MNFGKLYLVTYKQYYNDCDFLQVKVFAHNQRDCEAKVKESGLIFKPINPYSPNMGYIKSIEVIDSDIL